MPTIENTIEFIKKAHAGQIDKAGKPYWEHPLRVMLGLPANAKNETKMAALLHDTLEDTTYTSHDLLRMGYSEVVIELVELLTNNSKQKYIDKIITLMRSGNRQAIRIKLEDIRDNLNSNRMAMLSNKDRLRLERKYRAPFYLLHDWLLRKP